MDLQPGERLLSKLKETYIVISEIKFIRSFKQIFDLELMSPFPSGK